MSNPNNCDECGHKKTQDVIEKNDPQEVKLHCYMFRDEPVEVCMQHTARTTSEPGEFAKRLMRDFKMIIPKHYPTFPDPKA